MGHTEIHKIITNLVQNVTKRRVFGNDINFLTKSECLIFVGTIFHTMEAAKENEQCKNVFVCLQSRNK